MAESLVFFIRQVLSCLHGCFMAWHTASQNSSFLQVQFMVVPGRENTVNHPIGIFNILFIKE